MKAILKRIGRTAATELIAPDGAMILFSYGTPVAYFNPGPGYFRSEVRHSVTTSRHVNDWLRRHSTQWGPRPNDCPTVPQSKVERFALRF